MRFHTLRLTFNWVAAVMLFPILGEAQTSAPADEELAVLRQELLELRRDYGERIAAVEARLREIESSMEARVATPAPPPPPVVRGPSSVAAVNAYNPAIGLILDGKYRGLLGRRAG